MENPSPVVAVLCGGGARGAFEVGFYRALSKLGIEIDCIVSASVGALNGAAIAAGLTASELAELWLGIDRRDIVGHNWRSWLRPWAFTGPYTLDPLRRLLWTVLPTTRFEQLAIPLAITTTDLLAGHPTYWQGHGDLIEPLLASMSLPGAFPPVYLDGRPHVDGGIANNFPIDRAVASGARTIVSMLCTCCPPPTFLPNRALAVLKRSFQVALDRKYSYDIGRYRQQGIHIRIVRPHFNIDVGLLDFRYTKELIAAGYQQTLRYFEQVADAADSREQPGARQDVGNQDNKTSAAAADYFQWRD